MKQTWRVATILLLAKMPLTIGEVIKIYNDSVPPLERRRRSHFGGLLSYLKKRGFVESYGRKGNFFYMPTEKLLDLLAHQEEGASLSPSPPSPNYEGNN